MIVKRCQRCEHDEANSFEGKAGSHGACYSVKERQLRSQVSSRLSSGWVGDCVAAHINRQQGKSFKGEWQVRF